METRSKTRKTTDHDVDNVVIDSPSSSSSHHIANSTHSMHPIGDAHCSPALGNESLPTQTRNESDDFFVHNQNFDTHSSNVNPASVHSFSTRRSSLTRSSATVRVMRLEAEAELLRRRTERAQRTAELERQRERELAERERERQRELDRLEAEADELALQAKLATHYSDKSRSLTSQRTTSWVLEQNKQMGIQGKLSRDVHSIPLITSEALLPVPPSVTSVPIRTPSLRPVDYNNTGPTHNDFSNKTPEKPFIETNLNIRPQPSSFSQDPIEKLTHAITSLSDRPRKPELHIFSGDISYWMAFKTSYDRTKHLFSSIENMSRLNNAVRGVAHQAVASLLWASQDPEEVMRVLEQSFARPELLVAQEITALRQSYNKISTPEQINNFANRVRNCVTTIELMGQHEYLHSPELFRTVSSKLSEHLKSRFTDYAADNSETLKLTKIQLLSKFLLLEADRQLKYNFTTDTNTLTIVAQKSNFNKAKPIHHREFVQATTSASNNNTLSPCSYCKQSQHTIRSCKEFRLLTVNDRWQWIRKAKICYVCLKNNSHRWNECRAKRCGINGCTRRHHSLLHDETNTSTSSSHTSQLNAIASNVTAITDNNEESSNNDVTLKQSSTVIHLTGITPCLSRPRGLLKVLPVVVEGPNGSFNTTALLDEGSTATLIDGDVAVRIGAHQTSQEQLKLVGVSGMTTVVEANYVNFHIRGRNLPDRHFIEHARAITPLNLKIQDTCQISITDYAHLSDLEDELTIECSYPTVLIGAADWHLSISREIRVGKKNEPVASKTLLGWVLHGAISNASKTVSFVNHLSCESTRKLEELDTLLKSQYAIDSLGISKLSMRRNKADQHAVVTVESTAHRLEDGRFEVGLPWKESLPNVIPDSYPQALSRFRALERQMSKDEAFAKALRDFINDIISKSYAEECDPHSYYKKLSANASCVESNGSVRWYLPIFGVFHPIKKKIRVVHDAAAVTRGICLNSLLLQGPDLLISLLDILFRFREGPYAFSADIKEMFPQIKILPKDRDAQRFLWRDNINAEIKEFRMSSMIFGAVSSPFMALFLKDKNAKEYESQYPKACQAILNDHYMDDYLSSHFDINVARQVAADIVTVHNACGFEMRAWVSNVPEALSLVPKNLINYSNSEIDIISNKEVGVLGLKWSPQKDLLSFRVISRIANDKLTKRTILSSVMKVYDPLGLITPITIQGRILLQKLWREGVDWDTQIPSSYFSDFNSWFHELENISLLKIPRCYLGVQNPQDIQLHIFADGGEQAYACVAYWRFIYNDSSVTLALIGGKARVAPLKPISIPRLELQAALIATRFSQSILNAHRLKPTTKTFFWVDSTTVLKWLRSDARKFGAFEAHRLGEILETSEPSQWRWVPTYLNIADDATKIKSLNMNLAHRWFTGPTFLLKPPTYWPKEPELLEATQDENTNLLTLDLDDPIITTIDVPNVSRFSKWIRLVRSTARFLQGVYIFRIKVSRPITPNSKLHHFTTTPPDSLSVVYMQQAKNILFLQAQLESFPRELKFLKESQPIPRKSRIAALAPILDEEGLIRMNSRIKSAPEVNDSIILPIILDGRHHTTRLLILHYHIQAAHAFHETVLNELRLKYTILRARSSIRSVIHNCFECRRKRTPIKPQLGDLPQERLDHHKRPFTNIGLDYFGPLIVTNHRRKEKRWVALYTCLVSRAVHLELVPSLSTDSALLSLRRFIARRGCPSIIFSDNGTNFVGANRELRALFGEPIQEFITNKEIHWRFIPPASPFMGGAWERMVRSVKIALNACLKDQSPKEEILKTLLCEAEAIVNSRPLTYVSPSPEALQAITPFHFILGSSSVAPWTSTLTDSDLVRRCDWRRTLRLADHFWARWLREYLPTLRARGGTNDKSKNLCEGDVVVVADASLPRGVWPLGRVVKTFTGADGVVRVVDVITKGGTLRRPVRKLVHIVESE